MDAAMRYIRQSTPLREWLATRSACLAANSTFRIPIVRAVARPRADGSDVITSACGLLSDADLRSGAGRQLPRCLSADGLAARCDRVGAQPRRRPGRSGLRGASRGWAAPAGLGTARPPPRRGGKRHRTDRAARAPGRLPDQIAGTLPIPLIW